MTMDKTILCPFLAFEVYKEIEKTIEKADILLFKLSVGESLGKVNLEDYEDKEAIKKSFLRHKEIK